MIDPGFCKLYIMSNENIDDLQTYVDSIVSDIFYGMAVGAYVYRNEDFTPSAIWGKNANFIDCSRYYLDVGLDDDYESHLASFQSGVATLVSTLRDGDRVVIASCIFEDLIARETGWNWTEEQPEPPDPTIGKSA